MRRTVEGVLPVDAFRNGAMNAQHCQLALAAECIAWYNPRDVPVHVQDMYAFLSLHLLVDNHVLLLLQQQGVCSVYYTHLLCGRYAQSHAARNCGAILHLAIQLPSM